MTENETVTVRRDRVIAAARTCENAGDVLKALFPEVFERLIEPGTISCTRDRVYLYLDRNDVTDALKEQGMVMVIINRDRMWVEAFADELPKDETIIAPYALIKAAVSVVGEAHEEE